LQLLLSDRKQNSIAKNHFFQGQVPVYRVVVFVTTDEFSMQCSFICGDI